MVNSDEFLNKHETLLTVNRSSLTVKKGPLSIKGIFVYKILKYAAKFNLK